MGLNATQSRNKLSAALRATEDRIAERAGAVGEHFPFDAHGPQDGEVDV